jgi:hypothetical protein
MLNETLRSRWFSACLQAGLWLLLVLTLGGVGGRRPPFQEARPDPAAVVSPVPVAKLKSLFAPGHWSQPPAAADHLDPFTTSYFMPRTAPVTPPTTKKIAVTYQGYYQTGDGPRHVLVQFNGGLVVVPVGGSLATNLFVAAATVTNLTLTNAAVAGQTNVLFLNAKKEIEIPIR